MLCFLSERFHSSLSELRLHFIIYNPCNPAGVTTSVSWAVGGQTHHCLLKMQTVSGQWGHSAQSITYSTLISGAEESFNSMGCTVFAECFLCSAQGLPGNLRSSNRCVTRVTAAADVTALRDVTESMFELTCQPEEGALQMLSFTITEMMARRVGKTVWSLTETENVVLWMGKKRMAGQTLRGHLEYFAEPGFL